MKGQTIILLILSIFLGIISISLSIFILLPLFSEISPEYSYVLAVGGAITVICIVGIILKVVLSNLNQ